MAEEPKTDANEVVLERRHEWLAARVSEGLNFDDEATLQYFQEKKVFNRVNTSSPYAHVCVVGRVQRFKFLIPFLQINKFLGMNGPAKLFFFISKAKNGDEILVMSSESTVVDTRCM